MNSKPLSNILNGALKPWLISFEDERVLKGIIKQVQNKPNSTKEEIQTNLNSVLQPFPSLLKGISFTDIEPIQPLGSTVNLPSASTLLNHYYKALIDAEVVRYFNATIHNPLILDKALDVPFQIGHQSLKGIADLCNQTNNEIVEREFEVNQIPISDTTFFALTYLRNSLLALYFSIQEPFKDYLPTVYNSFEDFALYCLDNSCDVVQLNPNTKEIKKASMVKSIPNEPSKLSFGFKGSDINKLKNLFDDLCFDFTFLNEEHTSVDALVELLISKEIIPGEINIYLGCQTTEFVFIMDNLSKQFQRLTPTNIDKSLSFWSKPVTNKKPTLITADNYFKTRSKSKMRVEQQEAVIDIIQKYFP